jgi:hypothetical protein
MSGWRYPDGIILRCVDEIEAKKLVDEFHARFCDGHYAAKKQLIKSLERAIIGPPFSQMSINL